MSSPPIIPVESWLVPIAGDDPSGRNLAYEPEYDALREARRFEDATNQGDWVRDAKAADWNKVVTLGGNCLRSRTKDLQIAAWVAEALTRLHGFAGLRDGLTLLLGIQGRFWDSYHPRIDDGDIESRFGPFIFLNDSRVLPFLIRRAPVTNGLGDEPFSFARYQESRETDNLIKKNPEKSKSILAEGRITGKTFDDQVAQTPRTFYERLADDLGEALAAFGDFEKDTDARFGNDAPNLTNIGKTLDECQRWIEPILADKREKEPDPAPSSPVAEPTPEPDDVPTASTDPAPTVPGRGALADDFGRVLIEFRVLAQALAEAGAKLEENRRQYAEHQAEMSKLDVEYAEIARAIGRDGESRQLLRKVLDVAAAG